MTLDVDFVHLDRDGRKDNRMRFQTLAEEAGFGSGTELGLFFGRTAEEGARWLADDMRVPDPVRDTLHEMVKRGLTAPAVRSAHGKGIVLERTAD